MVGSDLAQIPFSHFTALLELNVLSVRNLHTADIQSLQTLRALTATMCYGVQNIDFVSALSNLEALHLFWIRGLHRFPDVSNLKNLKRVYLSDTKYTDISGFYGSTSIEDLTISCNISADMVRPLRDIPSLKRVALGLKSNSETLKAEKMFDGLVDPAACYEPFYLE